MWSNKDSGAGRSLDDAIVKAFDSMALAPSCFLAASVAARDRIAISSVTWPQAAIVPSQT
jgi:hypothetical protein